MKYILFRQGRNVYIKPTEFFEGHTETQVHKFIFYNNSRRFGHLLAHAVASAILKYNLKIYYPLHIS